MPRTSLPTITRVACSAMGTRFEIALVGDDASHLRAAGEEAVDIVEGYHARYSAFSPSSLLTHINQHAATEPVGVDRETFALLQIAEATWRATGGAFDITIGPLMRHWGFRDTMPPNENGDRLTVGMDRVVLDVAAGTVRFREPGISIDLGAIAKGFALDQAAAALREAGVQCALLHGGTSTIVAIGAPPNETGWPIRIADAQRPREVRLRDEALSVSAPRGRTIRHHDRTIGHIIDPRSHTPVAGALAAAAICDSAATADAWSTALLVLRARPDSTPAMMTTMIRIDDCDTPWMIDAAPWHRCCARPHEPAQVETHAPCGAIARNCVLFPL